MSNRSARSVIISRPPGKVCDRSQFCDRNPFCDVTYFMRLQVFSSLWSPPCVPRGGCSTRSARSSTRSSTPSGGTRPPRRSDPMHEFTPRHCTPLPFITCISCDRSRKHVGPHPPATGSESLQNHCHRSKLEK